VQTERGSVAAASEVDGWDGYAPTHRHRG
jgi:hypothetical protein